MSYLLTGIAFLLPTYLVRFEVSGIPTTLLEVLIYIVFVVGLIHVLQERKAWYLLWSRSIWLLPAALILVGATLGLLVAPDVRIALGLWKGFVLDPILVYILALAFLKTTDDALLLARGLFVGAAVVAIWSLFDAGSLDFSGRVIGPYAFDANASPNYLAFALAPLLPLAIWVGVRRDLLRGGGHDSSKVEEAAFGHQVTPTPPVGFDGAHKSLVALSSLLILLALVASASRAGLIAALGGLMVAFVLSRPLTPYASRLTKALVILLLVFSALSWFVVRPNFNLSPTEGGRVTASNNVRWQLWSATGELAQQHWLLGTGLGGFQQRFDELTNDRVNYPEFITPRARTPHNLLVGMWMETGLLGLAGIFMILVLVGKSLFAALRRRETQTLAAALLGSWFVLLAHGLVDQPIWKNDTMVMFWLLVALSAVLSQGTKKQHPSTK